MKRVNKREGSGFGSLVGIFSLRGSGGFSFAAFPVLMLSALAISLMSLPLVSLSAPVEGEQVLGPVGESVEESIGLTGQSSEEPPESFESYSGGATEPSGTALPMPEAHKILFEDVAKEKTIVDFEFKDADITDVFRTLSKISGVNIILDNSISGKATLSLKGIAFIDAVDLITKVYGYEYKYVSGTLLVASPLRMKSSFADEEITEVFKIRYADPQNIISIADIIIPAEKLRLDQRSRSVVASGTAKELEQLSYLISRLDRVRRGIEIEARIEEISVNALSDLGIEWKDITMNIDRSPAGVIEAVSIDFLPVLKMLEKSGNARLVSNQRIRVEDGMSATVLVGDKVPMLIKEETANGVIERYQYFEAGIKLTVTPIVTDDGYVDLNIKPEISSIHEFTEQNLPWLKTRELETLVKIRNGETVAIGGLLQTDEIAEEYKVPLLGDIPIIGGLFRKEDTNIKETELVIFVSVRFTDEPPVENGPPAQ